MPIFEKLITDEVNKQSKKQTEDKKKASYWLPCPGCGRLVVRKELLKKGCYICGWRGSEEDIESAKGKDTTEVTDTTTRSQLEKISLYKVDCPQCGTRVIRQQLIKNGCYLCGWKPAE